MAQAYTLVGVNGNAFSVIGYTVEAMKDAGFSKSEIDEYRKNAMSGNYNDLLVLSMDMIDQVNEALGLEDEEDEWEDEEDEEDTDVFVTS